MQKASTLNYKQVNLFGPVGTRLHTFFHLFCEGTFTTVEKEQLDGCTCVSLQIYIATITKLTFPRTDFSVAEIRKICVERKRIIDMKMNIGSYFCWPNRNQNWWFLSIKTRRCSFSSCKLEHFLIRLRLLLYLIFIDNLIFKLSSKVNHSLWLSNSIS